MRVTVLDNHDSFTWNLVHQLEVLGAAVTVVLNDRTSVEALLDPAPDALVVSPGPGRPEAAGICLALVRAAVGRVPLLGVCLGHQALALAHGATIVRAAPMHGKTSRVTHAGDALHAGLPQGFEVMRYHSLVVEPGTLAEPLVATAWAEDGTLMALAHRGAPAFGVQYHPESILTVHGAQVIAAFLTVAASWRAERPARRAPAALRRNARRSTLNARRLRVAPPRDTW